MDLAYDHIQEETLAKEAQASASGEERLQQQSSLNADLQEVYRAFSSSPWGARIGGFLGTVVKQGGSVYREAQQELTAVGQDASRGLTDLRDSIISRTRSLSLAVSQPDAEQPSEDTGAAVTTSREQEAPAHALTDSETVLSRLRGEAAKRLRDLQKAEDAADEALLRFGSNLRNFLKDAIKIAPPIDGSRSHGSPVMFESKDSQGRRVIHTSRFDAQLHVIHTSVQSFTEDPTGADYETWAKEFEIEKKTDDIGKDLTKFADLRTSMEKLVPDQVPYAEFWTRYYYLRQGIETAEARRRDLLKGKAVLHHSFEARLTACPAASAEEDVGWDEDSDDETTSAKPVKLERAASTESCSTILPPADQGSLKPAEPRKSNDEKSQADSDASYDVVGARSGVPSQAPSSPRATGRGDDSDEDWE